MPSSRSESEPLAQSVRFTQRDLVVTLRDGRTVRTPLNWYPRLVGGTVSQRRRWKLIGDGVGIHWPDLDEDLSVEGMLRGIPAVGAKSRTRSVRKPRRRTSRRN